MMPARLRAKPHGTIAADEACTHAALTLQAHDSGSYSARIALDLSRGAKGLLDGAWCEHRKD